MFLYIRILVTLSDPIRLRCLGLIARNGELCVCELVAALDLPQPKISRHLAVMREAGLLRDRRDAQWVHYSIPDDLDPAIRSIVEATLAAIAPTREAKRDAMRLSRTSRPERLRNGCVRPVVRG